MVSKYQQKFCTALQIYFKHLNKYYKAQSTFYMTQHIS